MGGEPQWRRRRRESIGFAAVQTLDRYGIELYSRLRWLALEREERPRFDALWIP